MDFLTFKDVSKKFEEFTLKISLSIKNGEILGVLGPSGCGKTTLLKTILGVLTLDDGDILINNKSITQLPTSQRNIGYIPQTLALFPHLTVYENIAFGLKIKKTNEQVIRQKVTTLLHLAQIERIQHKFPHEISGGQGQRVAVLRALATEPSILLLDEPLSSLDRSLSKNLRFELRRLIKQFKTTAIYVTHDPEEALDVCDTLALMKDGTILDHGTPEKLLKQPKVFETLEILGIENLFPIYSFENYSSTHIVLGSPIGKVTWRKQPFVHQPVAMYIPANVVKIVETSDKDSNSLLLKGTYLSTRLKPLEKQILFLIKNKGILLVETHQNNKVINKQDQYFLKIKKDDIIFF